MSKTWDIVCEDDWETDLTEKDLSAFNLSRVKGVEGLIQLVAFFHWFLEVSKSDCHCHGLEEY